MCLCVAYTGLACGSGGMFIQSGDFVNAAGMNANNTMTFYGQEKVKYNAQLCLMKMQFMDLQVLLNLVTEELAFITMRTTLMLAAIMRYL